MMLSRPESDVSLFSSASFRQSLSASLVRMFPSWGRAVLPELGFQLHRSFLYRFRMFAIWFRISGVGIPLAL